MNAGADESLPPGDFRDREEKIADIDRRLLDALRRHLRDKKTGLPLTEARCLEFFHDLKEGIEESRASPTARRAAATRAVGREILQRVVQCGDERVGTGVRPRRRRGG
jgi:hypothetical protein